MAFKLVDLGGVSVRRIWDLQGTESNVRHDLADTCARTKQPFGCKVVPIDTYLDCRRSTDETEGGQRKGSQEVRLHYIDACSAF